MQRATILIVDDVEGVREGLTLRLRRDFRVLSAASADEALEVLRREKVDLIMADHLMPGMSGLDFLRLARDRFPDAARIMLTGHADAELILKALHEGEVHRFLVKPVDPTELEVSLFLVLERLELERENRRLRALLSTHPGLAERLAADAAPAASTDA
jgi:DNA-binding NtrC family response regulator